MKYTFYKIGVDDSNLDIVDMVEEFGIKNLQRLSTRHKEQMIELFRNMADSLENGILSKKE